MNPEGWLRSRGEGLEGGGGAGSEGELSGPGRVSVGQFVGHEGFQSLQILVVQLNIVVPRTLTNNKLITNIGVDNILEYYDFFFFSFF